ncbi:Substance-K receptor [Stylophora pistillata]|uniref:Substance-K receptor n=1 Tax=Stylophora pistillata TaxID=50429 RepID=A0A2B4SM86_STYPI|nr:Substance-K receptor [Stylophora pistillata]
MSDSADISTTVVLAFLIVVGIIGNSLVCVVMMKYRDMRVPINYLLVNLAAADIMFATFITPQYVLSHAFSHPSGMTGTLLCKLLTGGNFAWVGAASSVFTLVNIAIERYGVFLIPGSWVFSLIVNFPVFLVVDIDDKIGACVRIWPKKWMPQAYNVAWFVVMAIIPLTVMVVLYSRVVYRLWFKYTPDDSEHGNRHKGLQKVRKRATLSVLVVSIIFAICWITDSIVYIVSHFSAESFGPAVYSVSNTMIMFNSAVNPFVYGLVNRRFRDKIKIMFGGASCVKAESSEETETEGMEMSGSVVNNSKVEERQRNSFKSSAC